MISSRQATEKYCLLRTTQHICEEDKHYALVCLGRQGAFKSATVYYIRAGKGLMLSVYKGNVHPVGLALVSRAQEIAYTTNENAVALAADRKCTGNQFL